MYIYILIYKLYIYIYIRMYVCFKGSCRTIMGVPGTIFEQWEGLRFCSSHWGVFFDRGIHLDGLTDITSDLYIYI